jgi:Zn-dependent M28 family amino/carboxypeptidase
MRSIGLSCENLEVSRVGNDRAREIILIGAHYDSVRGSPGANDNASGVAALLELSRLFARLKPDEILAAGWPNIPQPGPKSGVFDNLPALADPARSALVLGRKA